MKRILFVGILMWAYALGARVGFAEDVSFTQQKMANGMDLVLMESHKVPLVTLVLTIKAGAYTESPDLNGLTHLWEHMFFKGNKRLPNQEAFKERIKELGITYNGDTSSEKVRYFFTLPSVFLEEGIQFMADAISTPLLDQTELDKEIQVVLSEYDHYASKPQFDFYNLNRRLIYGELDYMRDPLGHRPTIVGTTREKLFRIRDEVMVPANSALIVGGDFSAAKVESYVKKYFADWKNPKDWKLPKQPAFPKFPASAEFVMTRERVPTAELSMTYEGPRVSMDPNATYAADVLAGLLGHLNGKFYKKYVDSGLAFSAGFYYQTQQAAGMISVDASTKPENVTKVKDMLKKEIKEWASPTYFTPAQLADVHRQLKIRHILERSSPSSYTKSLAFWWAVAGLEYYETYIPKMQEVSLADIQRFVIKWLVDKPHITGILLSPEGAKAAGIKDTSEPLAKKHLQSYYPQKYGSNSTPKGDTSDE